MFDLRAMVVWECCPCDCRVHNLEGKMPRDIKGLGEKLRSLTIVYSGQLGSRWEGNEDYFSDIENGNFGLTLRCHVKSARASHFGSMNSRFLFLGGSYLSLILIQAFISMTRQDTFCNSITLQLTFSVSMEETKWLLGGLAFLL